MGAAQGFLKPLLHKGLRPLFSVLSSYRQSIRPKERSLLADRSFFKPLPGPFCVLSCEESFFASFASPVPLEGGCTAMTSITQGQGPYGQPLRGSLDLWRPLQERASHRGTGEGCGQRSQISWICSLKSEGCLRVEVGKRFWQFRSQSELAATRCSVNFQISALT